MASPERTASLCPVCLARIPARYDEQGERVYQVKACPDHGRFRTLVWDGPPSFRSWQRPKIPTVLRPVHREVARGCPFDCGLCPAHRQRSCTIIIEVTRRCNLTCPFCYADAGRSPDPDPARSVLHAWLRTAAAGGDCHIQLSGGEPTLRDDLPAIVALGRECGFSFIQLNTNGIRLAHDAPFLAELAAAGLDSVFLQFDAVDPAVQRRLRGRDLVACKLDAVEACGRHGLGVVLVATLVPGVNDGQIGALVARALDLAPVVRGIHFQPVSYFGRFPAPPGDADRLTLPRLMRALQEQTGGRLAWADFTPPGCENARCSFHATYLKQPDGRLQRLGGGAACCAQAPQPAEQGARRTIARVARQWSAPPRPADGPFPPTSAAAGPAPSLEEFLSRAREHTFSVSAMAFQDVWNVDLERLRDCCIHVMSPAGHLVPFCAYNLTAVTGRRLYR